MLVILNVHIVLKCIHKPTSFLVWNHSHVIIHTIQLVNRKKSERNTTDFPSETTDYFFTISTINYYVHTQEKRTFSHLSQVLWTSCQLLYRTNTGLWNIEELFPFVLLCLIVRHSPQLIVLRLPNGVHGCHHNLQLILRRHRELRNYQHKIPKGG